MGVRDIKKAYPSVRQNGLWGKLWRMGVGEDVEGVEEDERGKEVWGSVGRGMI